MAVGRRTMVGGTSRSPEIGSRSRPSPPCQVGTSGPGMMTSTIAHRRREIRGEGSREIRIGKDNARGVLPFPIHLETRWNPSARDGDGQSKRDDDYCCAGPDSWPSTTSFKPSDLVDDDEKCHLWGAEMPECSLSRSPRDASWRLYE